jgi:general secretion pathway protein L
VAAEVDSLVFGQRRDAEGLGVVIADRARLAEGQAVLAEVGLRVRRILPDVLALPLEPDAWSLAIESGRALLRTGPSSGFVCEVASLDWSLAQAWHTTPEAQRPRRLLASGMDAEAVALPAEDLEVVDLAGELLPLLGQAADRAGGGVELPLADARPLAAGSRVRWALAAGCVLLGLGLATASLWWEGRGLAMANAGLQQEIESVFTTSFPGRRVQDARLQMQQEIDALESASAAGNSLLPLLAVLAGAFDKERQLRLELLEYRQGQLLVRLRARDVAQLERVKRTLERDAGNKVGIGAVNAGGDHVTAQLRIGRVAA